jgi:hypothetical protein
MSQTAVEIDHQVGRRQGGIWRSLKTWPPSRFQSRFQILLMKAA